MSDLHKDFDEVFISAFKDNDEETVHVDGSCSERGITILAQSAHLGLTTVFDSGSDEAQYTCYNYALTNNGREYLEKLKGVKNDKPE